MKLLDFRKITKHEITFIHNQKIQLMKKTLLITSVLLAFFCFSCDDEPLDSNIVLENPTIGGGGTGGGTGGGGTTTLTAYSYDVNSTLPIFGTIITNTDFTIGGNFITGGSTEITVLGITSNGVSAITRNTAGNVTEITNSTGGTVQNRTTLTYTGTNITQLVFEDLEDNSENYTYTFVYSGNTITRTNAAANESAIFTFESSNSTLIQFESLSGTTVTQTEILTYTGGNCISSAVTGTNSATNVFEHDGFTNPLKQLFDNDYLMTIFDTDNESEIGTTLTLFHSTNNWVRIETSQGTSDFTITYNSDNNITSRNGNFDLGDGVTIAQSEAFQY